MRAGDVGGSPADGDDERSTIRAGDDEDGSKPDPVDPPCKGVDEPDGDAGGDGGNALLWWRSTPSKGLC